MPLSVEQGLAFDTACENGDVDKVKEFLDIGVKNWRINSALYVAVDNGDVDLVRLLLGTGRVIVALDNALIKASRTQNHAIMRILLDAGADVDNFSENGGSALTIAATSGDVPAITMLLEAGADPNLRNTGVRGGDYLPLMYAIRGGHIGAVKALLDGVADVNILDDDLQKPLDLASEVGNSEIVALLHAAGATPRTDADLNLQQAARVGALARVKELLPTSDVESRGKALTSAVINKNLEMAGLLASPELPQRDLDWGLFYAAQDGNLELVQILVAAGGDLDKQERYTGYTHLISAATHGHLDVVKVLVEAGAKVNAKSSNRETALLQAAFNGYLEIVRYLAEHKARIDTTDSSGMSPLDYAIQRHHTEVEAFLREYGAELGRAKAERKLKRALSQFKRIAFKPRTKKGVGSSISSHFGGLPWLARDESWPRCPACREPLKFFLQLNLGDLPVSLEGYFGSGLLQFFYCTVCNPYRPFAPEQLVRIVHPDSDTPLPGAPEGVKLFPHRQISGWTKKPDYPFREIGPEDWRSHQVELPLAGDELDQFLWSMNLQRDKLWGWPNWVQDTVYPICPHSDRPMDKLILQIDSRDNVPHMWGDNGVGFIVQSPEHPEVVTFFYQCS